MADKKQATDEKAEGKGTKAPRKAPAAKKRAAPKKSTAKKAPAKKATAGKSTAAAAPRQGSSAAKKGGAAPRSPLSVSAEERWRMIAEAAYYKAAARDFIGGDPVYDWLSAEAEVDAKLVARR